MENAVDALKMAFSIFAFMIAIAVAVSSFSMAKTASDVIMYSKDTTNFKEYYEEVGKQEEKRIVGIETIVPTLYRYYKENYTVLFEDWGNYNFDTGGHGSGKLYILNTKRGNLKNFFNVDDETARYEPWTASPEETKKHLDVFLNGGTYYDVSTGEEYVTYSSTECFLAKYKDRKFIESIKVQRDAVGEITEEKRTIVYGLINL